jgi:hypothetical protein
LCGRTGTDLAAVTRYRAADRVCDGFVWHDQAMADDLDPPTSPDPAEIDPAGLKSAHERSGRMFKQVGLPFEEEEFTEEGDGGNGGATGDAADSGDDKDIPPADPAASDDSD